MNKNAPKFKLEAYSYWMCGVDLSQVDGIARSTLLVLVSEIGLNVSPFPTAKKFTAWMGISPNNKKTGGKIMSRKVPKQSGYVKEAFKHAANVVGNLKQGALNQFFKRILFKYGRQAAITATARKLAVIVWNMLSKKQEFNYIKDHDYKEQIRLKQISNMKRKMRRLNIKTEDLAF